jgi:hypothetical protein
MKTINCYLDDLKEKTGSDQASAKMLGIDRSSISNARKRGQIGDETAIKIADLLGVEREEVLIAAAIARSKEGEVKETWVKFAKNWEFRANLVLAIGLYCPMLFRAIYEAYSAISVYYVKYPRMKIKAA